MRDLKALGMRHAGYDVKEEYFNLVGEALVYALRSELQRSFKCDMEDAWLEVYAAWTCISSSTLSLLLAC